MLQHAGFTPRTLDDAGIPYDAIEESVEAFTTFEENAVAKAEYFLARSSGTLVLADDSGLAVDALAGAPGVHSKRWSGSAASGDQLDDANNRCLQRALAGHADRRARYVCVAVLAGSNGVWHGRGESAGVITAAPAGTSGFGYDPYFLSDELGMTFAEATREMKEAVSHRGRAVRAVLDAYRMRDVRGR